MKEIGKMGNMKGWELNFYLVIGLKSMVNGKKANNMGK